MSTLKRFGKYILLVIGLYFITHFLIFIGFNLNYNDIKLKGAVPEQISIEKAEATNKEGRVYGYISNSEDNNINGKYIKISLYDLGEELLATEYLKINDVAYGESRLFKSRFVTDGVKSYSISIVDEENT